MAILELECLPRRASCKPTIRTLDDVINAVRHIFLSSESGDGAWGLCSCSDGLDGIRTIKSLWQKTVLI